MKRITARLLKSLGACKPAVDDFRKRFPRGIVPSLELADKHADLNIVWAAEHLLTAENYAEYVRVEAAARAEYMRQCARTFVTLYLTQE